MPTVARTIVLGAGPVGLATALLLSAQGHRVSIYEAHPELELSDANSYPIGVNPRGQEALRRIDPALLDALRDQGEVIKAFHIYAGRRRVARLASGTLIATTRAFLTRILFEQVQRADAITYVPGHRLTGLSVADRTLTFEREDAGEVVVDAADARVFAADGVWSVARQAVADQVTGFEPRVGPWGVHFRVAYSRPQASAPGLDPAVHHIFSHGIYAARQGDGVWGVVIMAVEGSETEDLLLSTDPSDDNVRALRAYVTQNAPLAAPLLGHDDYVAYFARKPFGGAVVRCPRLQIDEWLLLLGDAAHSVLPPTGEGVNSGLEDAYLVAEQAAAASPTWFADYEAARLPDLEALGEYAWTLRDNLRSTDPARATANTVLRVADTIASTLRLPSASVEARLFGPDADRTPYRDAIGPWLRQRRVLYPPVLRAVESSRTVTAEFKRRLHHSDGNEGGD